MNKLKFVYVFNHATSFSADNTMFVYIMLDNTPFLSVEQLTKMADMFEKSLQIDRDDIDYESDLFRDIRDDIDYTSCLFREDYTYLCCIALYNYEHTATADALYFKRSHTGQLYASYLQRVVDDVPCVDDVSTILCPLSYEFHLCNGHYMDIDDRDKSIDIDITIDYSPALSDKQLTELANIFDKSLHINNDDKSAFYFVEAIPMCGNGYFSIETFDSLSFKRNIVTHDLEAD